MPIKLSPHAKFQIQKRRIPVRRVHEVVLYPDQIKKSFKNRRLRRKLFGSKILQVVTITEGPIITVISSYYLRRTI